MTTIIFKYILTGIIAMLIIVSVAVGFFLPSIILPSINFFRDKEWLTILIDVLWCLVLGGIVIGIGCYFSAIGAL